MKYRNILLVFAFAFVSNVSAKVVSQSEALQTATNFFLNSKVRTFSAASTLKEIWNSSSLSQGSISLLSNEAPTFYVFAPESGSGFVIVSAEDATTPILGYSFQSEAPDEELPCNLRMWFEAVHRYISEVRAEGQTASLSAVQQWSSTIAESEELLLETAQWGQRSPYNMQCPTEADGQCLTGCTATAFAIAMRYHLYPERGSGETEAYVSSKNGVEIEVGVRSLDHDYDWSNMPLEDITNTYTNEQADAVSTLMADLGYLFEANYSSSSTSATISPKQNAKVYEHFDYCPSMYWAKSSAYSDDDWHQLLRNELQTTGPVIFYGISDSGGAHLFLLDGYTDDDYFHVNWGWRGSSDGYYLLPKMTYWDGQEALINFKPNDGSETGAVLRMRHPGIVMEEDEIRVGRSFEIAEAYIKNVSATEFYGSFIYGLTDSEGNLKEWISSEKQRTKGLSPNSYIYNNPYTCTVLGDMENGDRIRMFYKNEGTEEWQLLTPETDEALWELVIGIDVEDVTPHVAQTNAASDITYSSAVLNGVATVVDKEISEQGFEYWADGGEVQTITSADLIMAVTLTGLEQGITYTYRAYATTVDGETHYGKEVSFTIPIAPTVQTGEVSAVSYNSAVLNGSVTVGSEEILEQGFEYWADGSEVQTITSADLIMVVVSKGLEQGVTYTYRAYAISENGLTSYGEEFSFTTIIAPTVQTGEASDITYSSAVLNGTVTIGDEEISEQGFEYWTAGGEVKTITSADLIMAATLTELEQGTTYTYRAYAITENGLTSYGEEVSFTTLIALTVQTEEASDITDSSAVLNGIITVLGEEILEQGFEYWTDGGEAQTITLADQVEEVALTGLKPSTTYTGRANAKAERDDTYNLIMEVTLTGLEPITTYTYRAYAKTERGETYGEEVTFTTLEVYNGISDAMANGRGEATSYYTPDGKLVPTLRQGVNIIRYSDGTLRKVLVK